jgi:hypothetical protein
MLRERIVVPAAPDVLADRRSGARDFHGIRLLIPRLGMLLQEASRKAEAFRVSRLSALLYPAINFAD